jgi:hypothetical protein
MTVRHWFHTIAVPGFVAVAAKALTRAPVLRTLFAEEGRYGGENLGAN